MLDISFTNQFKKELEKQKKRGKDPNRLLNVAYRLANEEQLESKYRNHKLVGNFKGRWECHIEPDWLLVYYKDNNKIIFERTGTHSDLFE